MHWWTTPKSQFRIRLSEPRQQRVRKNEERGGREIAITTTYLLSEWFILLSYIVKGVAAGDFLSAALRFSSAVGLRWWEWCEWAGGGALTWFWELGGCFSLEAWMNARGSSYGDTGTLYLGYNTQFRLSEMGRIRKQERWSIVTTRSHNARTTKRINKRIQENERISSVLEAYFKTRERYDTERVSMSMILKTLHSHFSFSFFEWENENTILKLLYWKSLHISRFNVWV